MTTLKRIILTENVEIEIDENNVLDITFNSDNDSWYEDLSEEYTFILYKALKERFDEE